MPAPAGSKRVKGVSIYRPFVFGSIARPFDPNKKPANVPPEHTHQWTVWVKGVNDEDISYWLKKVQFKLHETYDNSLRTLDEPPFEVTETGWGEFDIQIKLLFVAESHEKPQTTWHTLKLHPFGPNAEKQKEQRQPILSQNYEEIIFNDPVESFYDILTGGGKGRGKAKGIKGRSAMQTAEIPNHETPGNPYSKETEAKEVDRLQEALKKVEELIDEETSMLKEKESNLQSLRSSEVAVKKK